MNYLRGIAPFACLAAFSGTSISASIPETVAICGYNLDTEENWAGLYNESTGKIAERAKKNVIYLLSTTDGRLKVRKELPADDGLSVALSADGARVIAVTSDAEKHSSRVEVYDAKTGKSLNSFYLDNFRIASFWTHTGPCVPRNLLSLGSDRFSALGFQGDKACVVRFSPQREIDRKVLADFSPTYPMFISNNVCNDAALLFTINGDKDDYGIVHFGSDIEFRKLVLPDAIRNSFLVLGSQGLTALDRKLGLFNMSLDGNLQAARGKLEAAISGDYRPDFFGFDSKGNIIAAIAYLGKGAVPTGKEQFAIVDPNKSSIVLGPDVKPIKSATVFKTKEGDFLYTFPEKGSELSVYSLPDFKLVQKLDLKTDWPYGIAIQ